MYVVEMISRVDPVTAAVVYLEMEVGQGDVVLNTGQVRRWGEELESRISRLKRRGSHLLSQLQGTCLQSF